MLTRGRSLIYILGPKWFDSCRPKPTRGPSLLSVQGSSFSCWCSLRFPLRKPPVGWFRDGSISMQLIPCISRTKLFEPGAFGWPGPRDAPAGAFKLGLTGLGGAPAARSRAKCPEDFSKREALKREFFPLGFTLKPTRRGPPI